MIAMYVELNVRSLRRIYWSVAFSGGRHCFEAFVKDQVSTGRFNNVSEVVRAGLRLLEDQEQLKALKLQELRTAIQVGASSGPGVDSEQVFERLKRKYQSAA